MNPRDVKTGETYIYSTETGDWELTCIGKDFHGISFLDNVQNFNIIVHLDCDEIEKFVEPKKKDTP